MASLLAFIRADASLDVPVTPQGWDVAPEDNRWATIYPLGRVARPDVFFHARLIARASNNPGRALFVCTGPGPVLTRLATAIASDALPWSATWASLPALRADAGPTATAIKNAWPDERPLDADGNPVGVLVALYARVAGYEAESGES